MINFMETINEQFSVNNLADVITIVSLIVTVIGLVLGFILTLLKDSKYKKNVEKVNFWLEQLKPLIAAAEKQVGITSQGKKDFVKTRLKQLCETYGVNYDDNKVDALIEQLLLFSKQVNIDEVQKDKKESP